MGVDDEFPDRIQHPDFRGLGKCIRPVRYEVAGNVLCVAPEIAESAAGNVSLRLGELRDAFMDRMYRRDLSRECLAPPVDPRVLQCRCEGRRVGPRQAGYGHFPGDMTDSQAAPEPSQSQLGSIDLAERNLPGPERDREPQGVRGNSGAVGVLRTNDREQKRREAPSSCHDTDFNLQDGCRKAGQDLVASRRQSRDAAKPILNRFSDTRVENPASAAGTTPSSAATPPRWSVR